MSLQQFTFCPGLVVEDLQVSGKVDHSGIVAGLGKFETDIGGLDLFKGCFIGSISGLGILVGDQDGLVEEVFLVLKIEPGRT